jgi:large subunit ribosomal protein L28
MSRVCQVTGRKTQVGNQYVRRGLAKAKGGVGRKTTGITKRKFKINLQWKTIWVPEIHRAVRVRLSTRALRTLTKNGAYKTLLAAGLIDAPRGKKKSSAQARAGAAPAQS